MIKLRQISSRLRFHSAFAYNVLTEGTRTKISLASEMIFAEEAEQFLNRVGYSDIGGLGEQLSQIRELVELPLRHPKLFSSIGIRTHSLIFVPIHSHIFLLRF